MPCSGTFTGRTLANRSSSLRMATLALSMLGHGSPARGVVVGPLRMTWQAFSSRQHVVRNGLAAGRAVFDGQAVDLLELDPAALDLVFQQEVAARAAASCVMTGPMPSPPQTPMTIVSSLCVIDKAALCASCAATRRPAGPPKRCANCSFASLMSTILPPPCHFPCSARLQRQAGLFAAGRAAGQRVLGDELLFLLLLCIVQQAARANDLRLARADIAHKLGRFAVSAFVSETRRPQARQRCSESGKPLAQEYFVVVGRVLEFQRQDAGVDQVCLVDAGKALGDDGA